MMDEELSTFLEHHGVKGMKWGARRREDKSVRREAKAQKYESRAKVASGKADKAAERVRSADSQLRLKPRFGKRQIKRNRQMWLEEQRRQEKIRDQAKNDAERKRHGKLSQNQKKVLIGAGVVAALVATKVTYNQIQSGEGHRLMMNGKNFVQNGRGSKGVFPWKIKADLAKKDMDVDEIYDKVVKDINPGYGRYGSKMNCRRCTFAYEMRRRGMDVAATRTSNGRGQDVGGMHNVLRPDEKNWVHAGRGGLISRVALDARLKERTGQTTKFQETLSEFSSGLAKIEVDHNDILGSISKQGFPDGARGELGIIWGAGGGHSMAWEIVKGKPVIFDTQTGQKYLKEHAGDLASGIPGVAQAGITRLDNVPLNEEFLKRWLKNA